jgi:septum formation protein
MTLLFSHKFSSLKGDAMTRLILGSQSPRRKEILGHYSIPFEQATSNFDEEAVLFTGDPKEYVLTLSKGKGDTLADQFPGAAILTADTVVYQNKKIYNKPTDRNDAIRMLTELSGNWHSVFTGVTVRYGSDTFQQVEETLVEFNKLSPAQMDAYVNTQRWADKAAGYGIQTCGGVIVRQIRGCYYNVMGLPVNTLRDMLAKINIDLWNHLK